MKKVLSMVMVLVLGVMVLSACGVTLNVEMDADDSQTTNGVQMEDTKGESVADDAVVESVTDDTVAELFGSYEDILTEYSQKLRDATPVLIEEYNEAAKDNQGGLSGLATLCNEKVSKLAVISNEGIQEMAKLYYKQGSGAYEEYSEWAGKLQKVYMEEASKIQDAYMDSAL